MLDKNTQTAWWRYTYCLAKFSTISLYLTNLYVTKSFAKCHKSHTAKSAKAFLTVQWVYKYDGQEIRTKGKNNNQTIEWCNSLKKYHVFLIVNFVFGYDILTWWKRKKKASFAKKTTGNCHFNSSLGDQTSNILSHKRITWGEIYEPFMGLKSQVELTLSRPGQLGR